jgi:hypothetical protein
VGDLLSAKLDVENLFIVMRGILVEEVAAKQTISCSPLTVETENYDRKANSALRGSSKK